MPESGDFKSIQSLLQQVHKDAATKEAEVLHPPAAGPTEEELREIVAAFRARVEKDPAVRRLIDRYRRRGIYAVRPWHWATLAAGLVMAFTAIPYVTVYFSTRARIERAVAEALEAGRRGRHDEALDRLSAAVSLGAPPGRSRAALADVYRAAGTPADLERAARLYAASASDDPSEPLYLVREAEAWLALGRLEEARAAVEKALRQFPRSIDVLLVAGRYSLAVRNHEAAENYLRDLVNRDPANIAGRFYLLEALRARGNLAAVEREEGFLLGADPRTIEEAEILVGLADIYIRAGRRDDARRVLERLAGREEAPPLVLLTLARLAIDAADLAAADAHLGEAIRRAPDDPEAYVLRGEVRYARGDIRAALADVRTALEIAPRHARAHYVLGNILFYDLDDAAGAAEEFDRALALGLDDPTLLYNLGAARFLLGEHAAALRAFEALPPAWRRHPEVEWAEASARLGAGETESVRADLRRAALRRQDPRAYVNYAIALEVSGETISALQVLYNAARFARSPDEVAPVVRANLDRFLAGRPVDLDRDMAREIERRIAVAAAPRSGV